MRCSICNKDAKFHTKVKDYILTIDKVKRGAYRGSRCGAVVAFQPVMLDAAMSGQSVKLAPRNPPIQHRGTVATVEVSF